MSRRTKLILAAIAALLVVVLLGYALFAGGEGQPATPEELGFTTATTSP